MVKDAEQYAEDDKRKREEIETRNTADNLAYTAEKMLRDNGDKISDDLKNEIEIKVAGLRTALQGQDMAQLRSAMEDLQTSVQKAGQAVYSQTAEGGGESQSPIPDDSGGETPEGTVEGEFREV